MNRRAFLVLGLVLATALCRAEGEKPKPSKLKQLLSRSTSESSKSPTVVGVRGLDKNVAGVDSAARDFNAVDRLEAVTVTAEEIMQFAKEGNLR